MTKEKKNSVRYEKCFSACFTRALQTILSCFNVVVFFVSFPFTSLQICVQSKKWLGVYFISFTMFFSHSVCVCFYPLFFVRDCWSCYGSLFLRLQICWGRKVCWETFPEWLIQWSHSRQYIQSIRAAYIRHIRRQQQNDKREKKRSHRVDFRIKLIFCMTNPISEADKTNGEHFICVGEEEKKRMRKSWSC